MSLAVMPFAFLPTAASAEVCDKVYRHWPGTEPMTPLTYFLWSFANPFIILWLAAVCALVALGGRIARVIASCLCLLMAALSTVDIFDPGPFHEMALAEGCIASPWIITSFWTLLGGAILFRAFRPAPRRTA